jgi:ubiquinone/menaquinone biosynthesis C-methylase UbiE
MPKLVATTTTDPAALKARVREFWNANPCGSKFAPEDIGTPQFFAAIEAHRYATEWHIPLMVNFPQWQGKRVLEIGCGLGTDGVQFGRAGADYTAVDLTPRAIELVQQRFQQEGLKGQFLVADAENLPFETGQFDLVYSHGVLHHTPDTPRTITEVYRILKPGGKAMIMLYHKNSYNYYGNIMFFRQLGARLLHFSWGPKLVHRLTGENLAALVQLRADMRRNPQFFSPAEFLNQNTDGAGNPLAKVYTRRTATAMFHQFRHTTTAVRFLNKRWLPLLGNWLPRSIEAPLARLWGWHLWIIAEK